MGDVAGARPGRRITIHATNILKVGRTRSRAISTERVTTLGTMLLRKPPPAADAFVEPLVGSVRRMA
jgi:hypothetical protein